MAVVRHELSQMRIGNRAVLFFVVDINVVEADQFEKLRLVDHAQAKQLADTRFGDTILQLGQPAVRDAEALVAFGLRDSATGVLNVANSDIALVAQALKLLTCWHSSPHK